ncbi:MAG: transcription termination factor NusA [Saccharofermentanales bacterium]
MKEELIRAINDVAKERGLDPEVLYQSIEDALVSAYKREFNARSTDNIRGEIDRETGEMNIVIGLEVVETVEDPSTQISLEDAKAIDNDFELGDILNYNMPPDQMGRLAALTARNVISQKMNSAEKERIQNEFSSRIGEIATGIIQRKDRRDVFVDIGRAEAILATNEQMRTDSYDFNRRMKFLILKVDEKKGRPVIYVSRSHPNLVKKLFESEVPEIADGIVEIVAIAREAGSRSKIAVASRDENVDPVGSCVGQKGLRVQTIMDELKNEKIDVIPWSSDTAVFISNAMSPAKVLRVDTNADERSAKVVVPDQQLSLAIGREGQNARLAARLTGWKIDIKSESQFREMIESEFMNKFTLAVESAAQNEAMGGLDAADEAGDESAILNDVVDTSAVLPETADESAE